MGGIPTSTVLSQIRQSLKDLQDDRDTLAQALLGHLAEFKGGSRILAEYLRLRDYLRTHKEEQLLFRLDELEHRLLELPGMGQEDWGPEEILRQKVRDQILSREFPECLTSLDQEIPRYFQNRKEKRLQEARNTYQSLTRKYPEAESRSTLLRLYHRKNPLFPVHYFLLRRNLAEKIISGVEIRIRAILDCFASLQGPNKSLALMNALQRARRLLPPQPQAANTVLERLLEYSQGLDYHRADFSSAAELLAEYMGNSLFRKPTVELILPSQENTDEERPEALNIQTIDLKAIRFTDQEKARITINSGIDGDENRTLAFCHLYWLQVQDPELENLVYLYSLKFQGPEREIFHTVKQGRLRGWKDESILWKVYGLLSRNSRYDYNIRKEITMLKIWRRIKPQENQARDARDPHEVAQERIQKKEDSRALRRVKVQNTLEKQRQAREAVSQRAQALHRERQEKDRRHKEEAELKIRRQREKQEKVLEGLRKPQDLRKAQEWTAYEGPDNSAGTREKTPQRIARLEALSNRPLMPFLRRTLESNIDGFLQEHIAQGSLSIKPYELTLAALSIKDFILSHLASDDWNWSMSNERLYLKDLGLNIPDLHPLWEKTLVAVEKDLEQESPKAVQEITA